MELDLAQHAEEKVSLTYRQVALNRGSFMHEMLIWDLQSTLFIQVIL